MFDLLHSVHPFVVDWFDWFGVCSCSAPPGAVWLWFLILISLVSLLFTLHAAKRTQLFYIKGDLLEPFR